MASQSSGKWLLTAASIPTACYVPLLSRLISPIWMRARRQACLVQDEGEHACGIEWVSALEIVWVGIPRAIGVSVCGICLPLVAQDLPEVTGLGIGGQLKQEIA